MNFQELGLTLQREREAKGLTMESVMEATKISRINLVALEKGDRSSLPHPVYTKGFVKSYARLLGLDSDELSMVVDREYQSDEKEVEEISYDVSPAAEKAFQEADAPSSDKRSVWPSILTAVALICAVLLVIVYLNKDDRGGLATDTAQVTEPQPAFESVTPESEAVQVEPSDPVVETVAPVEEQDSQKAVTSPEEAPEQVEATSPVQPEQKTFVAPEQPASEQPVTEAAAQQDAIKYDHVLIIRATTDKGCWVGVWKGSETKMARDFVLEKGEPLRLMFNNPRRVRIGNVAGVEVTYNGNPYPLADNKSNIQTLMFGMN